MATVTSFSSTLISNLSLFLFLFFLCFFVNELFSPPFELKTKPHLISSNDTFLYQVQQNLGPTAFYTNAKIREWKQYSRISGHNICKAEELCSSAIEKSNKKVFPDDNSCLSKLSDGEAIFILVWAYSYQRAQIWPFYCSNSTVHKRTDSDHSKGI